MKLLIIKNNNIYSYFFNPEDSNVIKNRATAAGKNWADNLLGFFICNKEDINYAAITVKDGNTVESMEYIDIDRDKPEFVISDDVIQHFTSKPNLSAVSLSEFEDILNEILSAPLKARKWEVYPEISQHYPDSH